MEFLIGDHVKLVGKTKHAKNRIQQFGDEWRVVAITPQLDTTKHRLLSGPFLCVVARHDADMRWVAAKEDPDFQVK